MAIPIYDGTGTTQSLNLPGDYNSADRCKVVAARDTLTLVPTLDTSAYADGDVLFDAVAVSLARVAGLSVTLGDVKVIDKDDVGAVLDLFFFDSAVALGTSNAAPSISDTDAAKYLGHVRVGTGDYVDLGGSRVGCVPGVGLELEPNGSINIYVGGIIRQAATFTATGLTFKFGVHQS